MKCITLWTVHSKAYCNTSGLQREWWSLSGVGVEVSSDMSVAIDEFSRADVVELSGVSVKELTRVNVESESESESFIIELSTSKLESSSERVEEISSEI